MIARILRALHRARPSLTWACDQCGAINGDNQVECWSCGS